MLWGGELVLRGGAPAGQVVSAAWGATVGSCVGLAFVWDPAGGRVEVEKALEVLRAQGGRSGRVRP